MFSGSLGTSVGYAAGAALTAKLSGSGGLTVTSFGDGTANAGILFETLNLSAMLALPVVFVCQDNQFATSLRATYSLAGNSVVNRARAFGIPAVDVDGNDVLAVRAAVGEATDRARAGGGPSLVHALTYRIGGHFMSDPEVYRTTDEVERWRAKDPIERLAATLIAEGHESAESISARRAHAEHAMTEAITRALNAADAGPVVIRDATLAGGGH
jgi:TPP-dependent pyruvate/acetoin dehydrogenase alpha subunit